jgi:hypothetical protein
MTSYLPKLISQLNYYKSLGETTINKLTTEQLLWQYNEASNSIAIIVQHISGNMLSRFTDFLTSDGEKIWRNRDVEFETVAKTKEQVLDIWHKGWQCLFNTINTLSVADLEKIITIRQENHTVIEALNRQLAHYPYHIGQIVFIGKMILNDDWQSLSIPKNKSQDFNKSMEDKFGK